MKKKELIECLVEDKKRILGNTRFYHIVFIKVTQHAAWKRWKYVRYMRLASFYEEKFRAGNVIYIVPTVWYLRKKNILGNKLGFEMGGGNWKRLGCVPQWTSCYSWKISNWKLLYFARR